MFHFHKKMEKKWLLLKLEPRPRTRILKNLDPEKRETQLDVEK